MHVGSPRTEWAELPDLVRAEIEGILGDRVVRATTQAGGFSPGVAAVVELASGDRAFVKVADESFNPQGAELHRQEAAFMKACPSVPAARLRGVLDTGGWVALVLDAIGGRLPDLPWQPVELEATLAAVDRLREVRAPASLPRFVEKHASLFDGWRSLAAGERDITRLDPWVIRHLEALAGLEDRWTDGYDGDVLVHGDVRADNVLLTQEGAVLVDWAQPGAGSPWADLVLFLPSAELAGAAPAHELWVTHGPDVPADLLVVAVAAFTGYLTSRSLDPVPPSLPTIRQFQADQAAVAQRWLRHLVDWP